MAYKIIWTETSVADLKKIIDYLKTNWSMKVAQDFQEKLQFRLKIIAENPISGPIRETPNIRKILITKHNYLYYRLKDTEIIIDMLFDTRQNPENRKE